MLLPFAYMRNRKFLPQYLSVFVCCVLLTGLFVLQLKMHPENSRLGEILLPNNPAFTKTVDESRKTTMDSPLTSLYENKLTVYGSVITTKFFKTISPTYLLLSGDSFFPIWQHGFFYIIDVLFLLLGIIFIFKQHRDAGIVFFSLIVLGTIPQILHNNATGVVDLENMSPHIVLIFPFLILFIALGISSAIDVFKNIAYQRFVAGAIVLLYVFSLFNFINVYF